MVFYLNKTVKNSILQKHVRNIYKLIRKCSGNGQKIGTDNSQEKKSNIYIYTHMYIYKCLPLIIIKTNLKIQVIIFHSPNWQRLLKCSILVSVVSQELSFTAGV